MSDNELRVGSVITKLVWVTNWYNAVTWRSEILETWENGGRQKNGRQRPNGAKQEISRNTASE